MRHAKLSPTCWVMISLVASVSSNIAPNTQQDSAGMFPEKWCFRKTLGPELSLIPEDCTHLHLASKPISDKQARALSSALHHHPRMSVVFLTSTSLSEKAVGYIADALHGNNRIEDLHVGYNKINDNGAHYFANALRRNTMLKRLHLESNEITNIGANELLQALKKNIGITELYLRSNQATVDMLQKVQKLVDQGAKRDAWHSAHARAGKVDASEHDKLIHTGTRAKDRAQKLMQARKDRAAHLEQRRNNAIAAHAAAHGTSHIEI